MSLEKTYCKMSFEKTLSTLKNIFSNLKIFAFKLKETKRLSKLFENFEFRLKVYLEEIFSKNLEN